MSLFDGSQRCALQIEIDRQSAELWFQRYYIGRIEELVKQCDHDRALVDLRQLHQAAQEAAYRRFDGNLDWSREPDRRLYEHAMEGSSPLWK